MNLLLDTHLLLWAASEPRRLPTAVRRLIDDPANELVFSVASLWEIAIKSTLGRADFVVDVRQLRRGLLENDYVELPISGAHAMATDALPLHHRDPFDRLLLAQARHESLVLLTADEVLAQYGAPVKWVTQ